MTVLVLLALGFLILIVWQPILLRTILWPPLIDQQGYHSSDLWERRRKQYWKDHPKSRCRVSFVKAETTWHVLSFRRVGWLPRPIILKRERKALHLHEWIYPPNRRYWMSDMWLTPLTPSAHRRLHRFDRWLFPWDRRNRLLWLSSFLYIYGRYGLVAIPIVIWLKVN